MQATFTLFGTEFNEKFYHKLKKVVDKKTIIHITISDDEETIEEYQSDQQAFIRILQNLPDVETDLSEMEQLILVDQVRQEIFEEQDHAHRD